MKLTLIFASLLAVALAGFEDTQQLDGSQVEIMDDVLGSNPFRDNSGIFRRSVLEGGLGFGRHVRQLPPLVICAPGSSAVTTIYGPGQTSIDCHALYGR